MAASSGRNLDRVGEEYGLHDVDPRHDPIDGREIDPSEWTMATDADGTASGTRSR